MIWYTGMCGSNGRRLTTHVSFMVKNVLYGALDPWFHNHDATIPNGTVIIGRTLLVGMGHSGPDLIVPLMLTMARALALYYRFLGTASILLRRGKISG